MRDLESKVYKLSVWIFIIPGGWLEWVDGWYFYVNQLNFFRVTSMYSLSVYYLLFFLSCLQVRVYVLERERSLMYLRAGLAQPERTITDEMMMIAQTEQKALLSESDLSEDSSSMAQSAIPSLAVAGPPLAVLPSGPRILYATNDFPFIPRPEVKPPRVDMNYSVEGLERKALPQDLTRATMHGSKLDMKFPLPTRSLENLATWAVKEVSFSLYILLTCEYN